MTYLFIQYPKCSTCQKAAKWLKENNIDVESRDIVLNNPTTIEFNSWINISNKPIQKFFNTNGLRYKALNIKDSIKTASNKELIELLSSEGMLVKRPILVAKDFVLVGFNQKEWQQKLLLQQKRD